MNKREYKDFDPEKLEEQLLEATDEFEEGSSGADGHNELPEEVMIIGVRFREAGKIYYFDPAGIECSVGEDVIVKTARGSEIGRVVVANKLVKSADIVLPLRELERKATAQDLERHERNLSEEDTGSRSRHEADRREVHVRQLETALQLHRRKESRLQRARQGSRVRLQDEDRAEADRHQRRGEADGRARSLRTSVLLRDVLIRLRSGIDQDGEGTEPLA